ncbi:Soluble scavenger receptor cysteine-rich domain-containing protein SSC5D [Geodia barretti]|uniref:Soluble scavenger receptor cysteine-rich domain-containing protein SSC5D n=1 Tax=Geodia barretti TaxID=519541 RepID=A0AA35T424_GEOBA|nr:Soluble scavenger receptor cysteine-rich domain-containing protein SSC5D [Geodia barretti]
MSVQKGARLPLLPVAALTLLAVISAQQNQGVRLAGNSYGSHIGRVEVNYYGRWGTICESGWSIYDADVICGMLNYTGYICAIRSATSTFGEGTGSVWLTNLACRSYDTTLDQCRNSNPYNINPCTHSRDAALICQDPTVMPVPYEITVLNRTTRSIKVGWQLKFIPPLIQAIDFRLNITTEGATFPSVYVTRVPVTNTSRVFNYTLPRLSFNTSYTLYIRAEGEYQWCPYNELLGKYSEPVVIATADMIPPSTLPMRLLSQNQVTEPYIGRLQVYHDGQWGNVCDDLFGADDADVACLSLNYTDGAICYANSPFPPSSAPILLDNIDCSNADRFEDCIHRGWGVHDCSLSESIGLICNPGTSVAPLVTGLRITAVAPYSITVAWDPLRDVRRYRVMYGAVGGRTQLTYVRSSTSEWTLSRLVLNQNYTINISAAITFSSYRGGNCYSYFYGEPSDSVYALTKESPPTIAISAFHVTVVNSTVVEVTWQPPSTTVGINGDLRGFKLFVDKIDGNQTIIDIPGALNRAYFVTDLEELATYLFSILMYTVGDGPLSVRLQVTMPNASYVQLFQVFGRWGDGIEVLRAYAYNTGYNVLCGSNTPNAAYEWRFANGSRIGISNSGFRAAHFVNGTAVLQIGTASVYPRRLNACDGGVYTCIGTYPDGSRSSRNFTLIYGSSQPPIGTPRLIQRSSRWVQIGWDPLDCDGGFPLSAYVVEYRTGVYYYYSYTTLGEVTRLNYTIRELSPLTSYYFRIGRKSSSSLSISYSSSLSVTTLESGPSEPRSVVVRVGFNSEVCATWVQPALPVGTIILYNLYAEVVENSVEAVDVVDLPGNTAVKSLPGSQRSGCMRLSVTGVIYHFQMSAVVIINGRRVEGALSPYSPQTTLFVPEPGLSQPVNVRASSTNTSVTLQWELPEDLQLDENTFYNVCFHTYVHVHTQPQLMKG